MLVAAMAALVGAAVDAADGAVERLYVLDCGQNIGKDQSRWSPGVNEGTAMAGAAKPAFAATQTITRLTGDRDVFRDGSVMILSTPGHTPGHRSLLVRLPKTGVIVLSGDAVHFEDNWTNRRVPSMNFNRDQTLASLERLAAVLAEKKAQLWINHDKAQSATLRYAPASHE